MAPPDISKKRPRPKIYTLAVYVVALFLIGEIVMLGGIWLFRRDRVKLETNAPSRARAPALNTKAPEAPPVPNLPKPEIIGRLNISQHNEKIAREVANLNADAQNYIQLGDFSLAESALNQALQLDPAHPPTLADMGILQEALGNNEQAMRYWDALIAQGAGAGKFLPLARQHAAAIQPQVELERRLKQKELRQVMLKRRFVIAGVNKAADGDNVRVDFVIKRADRQLQAEIGKMRLQLYFYDCLPDGRFAPKKIDTEFAKPPDWLQPDTETLAARFTVSRNLGGGAVPYGYLFRIYYDGKLQDERAEPAELLKIFPSE